MCSWGPRARFPGFSLCIVLDDRRLRDPRETESAGLKGAACSLPAVVCGSSNVAVRSDLADSDPDGEGARTRVAAMSPGVGYDCGMLGRPGESRNVVQGS
jgi:hypothetical protein